MRPRSLLVLAILVLTLGCASKYRKNEAPHDLTAGTVAVAGLSAAGQVTSVVDGGMAFMGGSALFAEIAGTFDKLKQAQVDQCITEAVLRCMRGELSAGGYCCENERWSAYIYPKLVDGAPGVKVPGVQVLLYEKGPFNFVETEGGLFHPFRVAYPNTFLELYLKQQGVDANAKQGAQP